MTAPDDFRLNSDDVVVLFAHLQPPIVANSGTASPKLIEAGARALAEVSNTLGLPMLFSMVPQDDITILLHTLVPWGRDDNVFVHRLASPFMDECLTGHLEKLGRRTLVVAGYATDAVVLFTALDALAAGYEVVVVLDACGARSTRGEEAALRRMERAGVVVTTVMGIMMGCAPEFGEAPGREAFAAVKTLLATHD